MGAKRKRHSAEFKARVALEAIKGLKTQSELATQYNVHPVQISKWKKELLGNVALLFGNKQAKTDEAHEQEKAQLFEQIGRLKMENDFLKKKMDTLD